MWQKLKSFVGEKFISTKKNISQCNICLQKYSEDKLLKICLCDHRFCKKCIQQHIDSKIKSYQIIQCPEQNCQAKINQSAELFIKLPQGKLKIYEKIKRFHFVSQNPNFKLCPKEQCSGMIKMRMLGAAPCDVCGQRYCSKCLYKEHRGKCEKQSILHLENDLNFIQCMNCDFIIEKNQGCDHIKCRCGFQLCYKCGGLWKGPGHLCIRSKSFQKIRSICLFFQNKKIVNETFNAVKKVLLFNLIISGVLTLLKMFIGGLFFLFSIFSKETEASNTSQEDQVSIMETCLNWIISLIVGIILIKLSRQKIKPLRVSLTAFTLSRYLPILFDVFYYEVLTVIFIFNHLIAFAIGGTIFLLATIFLPNTYNLKYYGNNLLKNIKKLLNRKKHKFF